MPPAIARWVTSEHTLPATERAGGVPYRLLRKATRMAEHLFGPVGSALTRSFSAAFVGSLDRAAAQVLTLPLAGGAHPSILVPHLHDVAVVAIDMRGFSNLTGVLDDSQYLAGAIGEYLTMLTSIVERHGGVVYQYTGDGLLAVFLPEVTGQDSAAMLSSVVTDTARELHAEFDALYEHWREEWKRAGRPDSRIGLGIGVSYGRATIGLLGPMGKKQFGVVGEPINLAAFLCSQALSGVLLVEHASFERAGTAPPEGRRIRLRSKKRHQRIDALSVPYGRAATRRSGRRRRSPPALALPA